MGWTRQRIKIECAVGCFLAAAVAASAQDFAVKLTVVTPTQVVDSAVVTVRNGRISAIRPGEVDANAITVDGVMFPGMIDLHNHLTWNVLPNWKPPRLFANRYEWEETSEYAHSLSRPHSAMMSAGAGCDMNRFGEVKSIVNGGTVTVGSYGPTAKDPTRNRCIAGLARNADFAADLSASHALNQEPFRNFVFPFELGDSDQRLVRTVDPNSADPNVLHAAVVHVAEGTDSAARREFQQFKAHQYLRRGVSIIHGVALDQKQIRELARGGVGLIWSPHSNFTLYGKTADILTAIDAGMTIALAPDWSPTGSAGMLEEIGIAYRYDVATLGSAISEPLLVQMATLNPARLAGLDGQLGSIEAGKFADFVVMRRRGTSAYQALLLANPADVQLVTIGGLPVYGDRALMRQLLPKTTFEEIEVCGELKALHIVDEVASDQSWQHVRERLAGLMKQLGLSPATLVSCGNVEGRR